MGVDRKTAYPLLRTCIPSGWMTRENTRTRNNNVIFLKSLTKYITKREKKMAPLCFNINIKLRQNFSDIIPRASLSSIEQIWVKNKW